VRGAEARGSEAGLERGSEMRGERRRVEEKRGWAAVVSTAFISLS
jgi:hypothetical protein